MPLLISGWSLQDTFCGKLVCMGGRGHDPMTFKRNLHSLAVLLLILCGSACLFLRQTGVRDAMFLPEIIASPIFENGVYYDQK
jgi:hypothetical protein